MARAFVVMWLMIGILMYGESESRRVRRHLQVSDAEPVTNVSLEPGVEPATNVSLPPIP